jgi:Ca2+/Na+ antiporter
MKRIKDFFQLFIILLIIIVVGMFSVIFRTYDYDYGQLIYLFMCIVLIVFFRELFKKDKDTNEKE